MHTCTVVGVTSTSAIMVAVSISKAMKFDTQSREGKGEGVLVLVSRHRIMTRRYSSSYYIGFTPNGVRSLYK